MQLRTFVAAAAASSIALSLYACSDTTFPQALPVYAERDGQVQGLTDTGAPLLDSGDAANIVFPTDTGAPAPTDAGDAATHADGGDSGPAGDSGDAEPPVDSAAPDAETDAADAAG